MEELNNCGEISELPKYFKKAQNLEQKLMAANERIEQFNSEEEAFNYEATQYPLRLQTLNTLQPFSKLYEIGVEFTNKFKDWMEGPMQKVIPDQVEQDVGNYWRQLFKLERQFQNQPMPRKLAAKLRSKVDEFKENLPLVMTLFNPGKDN